MDIFELSSSLQRTITTLHKELRKHISLVSIYSMTELETIAHLSKNPALLPSQLATLTRVKTQSMSQILHKLENDALIQRKPCSKDKRKIYISLTAYGTQMLEKMKKDKNEWLKNTIEAVLNEEEVLLLEQALPILHKLIDQQD
ncbi:MarR family transcriptional regulator [Sulfurospirillum diekertiae]|uniref:MarR family transcriptional regulator n=1 Tax=Sulfurospirillum diekertiae TaxID=1854492 RepID=A0A6G9VWK4_9BACT|nr:MarR family transcriptional regulator [Sulfurospirillum diekertiae]QIR77065.1 MarR family transcriptional regulator [Sulfurospirillum diekertiae]QIR79678.1 MarR family transcriptional regulator [Sulfurospirillum diekertiae]